MKRLIELYFFFALTLNSYAQCTWVAETLNPVIVYEQSIPNTFWNDPSVLKEDSTYNMWLSGGDITLPFGALNSTLPYYAGSNDGLSWNINTTALFTGNGAGTYDGYKVETPSVIKNNGLYHMYYTSRSDPDDIFTISHATSVNIDNGWTKDANNPVISPTGTITDWNGAQVAEPAIVVKDSIFYLFFTAVGCRDSLCSTYPASSSIKALRSIGLVTSTDGTNFGAPAQVLTQGLMYPDSLYYEGYSTPYVYIEDSIFHLYYDVYQYISLQDEYRQVAIHHAISSDGYNWTEDSTAIFKRTDFIWTAMEIRAPTVINDNGIRKMWFAGNTEPPIINPEDAGIGYAECNTATDINQPFENIYQILVYPNPFSKTITLEIKCIENYSMKFTFQLFDILGRTRGCNPLFRLENLITGKININTDNLPAGLYLYRVKSETNILKTGKIIKR